MTQEEFVNKRKVYLRNLIHKLQMSTNSNREVYLTAVNELTELESV